MTDYPVVFLVELALKSTVVLAVAFAVAATARRLSSEERHMVWAFALAGLLVLPTLSILGPNVEVSVREVAASLNFAPQPVKASALSAPDAAAGFAGSMVGGEDESLALPIPSTPLGPLVDPLVIAAVSYAVTALALFAWIVLTSLQVAISLRKLDWVTNDAVLSLLEQTRRRRGIRRRVRLKVSSSDVSPWAWGLFRPVIVLPESFADMSADSQRNAIEHELAHIARFDFLSGFLGYACCAVYWFQPLAWLALRRMGRESERACDDRVLLAGSCRTTYAAQLLEVARSIHGNGHRPMTATAMAGLSPVAQRITSILDINSRRRTVSNIKIVCTSILTLTLIVPLAALTSPEAISPVTDPSNEAFQSLVQEGPANSSELELIVRTFVAHDRKPDAVNVLADYISRGAMRPGDDVDDRTCRFCGSILESEAFGRSTGELLPALLSAFDAVENRARAAGDGDLLLRLAAISGASGSEHAMERGTYYLLEGFRIGNLSDKAKLAGVQFLNDMGWYSQAKSLAEKLHNDEASSLYQSAATQSWIRQLDFRIAQANIVTQRLLTPDVSVDTDSDMRPLYRRAPVYPPAAVREGKGAWVILEFTINEMGKTEDIKVVDSSDGAFNDSAVEALSAFLYAPVLVDGVPVAKSGVQTTFKYVMEE